MGRERNQDNKNRDMGRPMIIELVGGPLDGQILRVEESAEFLRISEAVTYEVITCTEHPNLALGHYMKEGAK